MNRRAVEGILIEYDYDDGYLIWCEEVKISLDHEMLFQKGSNS